MKKSPQHSAPWGFSKKQNSPHVSSDEARAFEKCMRLLARRDHSVKELREKLSPFYTNEVIECTLTKLNALRLLKSPEELSRLWSESLHRQGKSYRQIENKLHRLNLPSTPRDKELEKEKCLKLIERRFSKSMQHTGTPHITFEDKVKIKRYLLYRGYDHETIMSVLRGLDEKR